MFGLYSKSPIVEPPLLRPPPKMCGICCCADDWLVYSLLPGEYIVSAKSALSIAFEIKLGSSHINNKSDVFPKKRICCKRIFGCPSRSKVVQGLLFSETLVQLQYSPVSGSEYIFFYYASQSFNKHLLLRVIHKTDCQLSNRHYISH